ncbi:tyrosine-type recombinase/integrase [Halalkaliarchaeum sp. AArc-GB]|uniref:tyrosine-type recombinase/integrase n=1 Tax=Halalkaliarchaeum sp. AArc-GB TaxID=3074078 RepID=UPI002855000A|nr:tyrosine-type recombinase/integrase [Halalkaliarchaeum sp. AArc-GB]MDR5673112.1 tyrosine-type recombinase/integrase [Halalkaliarchaeum sp. AArc-GB]
MTEDELEQLLEAARDHPLRFELTVRTLAFTGMRADEFAHMTADWMDWQGEKVRVPAEEGDWTPKTSHAVRTIPLKDVDTLRLLRQYFKRNDEIGVTRQTIRNRVCTVAKDADLDKKVTPHILRHTYGTTIAHRGASPQYIRQTMGHADLSSANDYLQYAGTQLDSEANELW